VKQQHKNTDEGEAVEALLSRANSYLTSAPRPFHQVIPKAATKSDSINRKCLTEQMWHPQLQIDIFKPGGPHMLSFQR